MVVFFCDITKTVRSEWAVLRLSFQIWTALSREFMVSVMIIMKKKEMYFFHDMGPLIL